MGAKAYAEQQLNASGTVPTRVDLLVFSCNSPRFPEMQVNRAGCAGNLCVKCICSEVDDDRFGFGSFGFRLETSSAAGYLIASVFNFLFSEPTVDFKYVPAALLFVNE